MNIASFVSAENRKTMREMVNRILANGSCEEKFKIDTAKIYICLLDTIDYFEQANFVLSKKNVDLEFEVMDTKDALAEYIKLYEEGREANETNVDVSSAFDDLFERLDTVFGRLDKLEARITKKKVKSTTKKVKK